MPAEVENMFSVKERPWHGLGTVLEEAPSIEEGIKQAGLDWEVTLRPIETDDDDRIKLNTHKIIVREDNQQPLGIVSSKYKALQNKDAFNFFEPFLENNMASLETAGSLFGGKKVFVLAKINSTDMEVQKDDIVEKYILLSNSHDGSQALRVGYVAVRVVCNNTLSMALHAKDSSLIRIAHKGNIKSSLNDLRDTMDLVNKTFICTEERYKQLTKKSINSSDLRKYVHNVFSRKQLEDNFNNQVALPKYEVESFRKKLMSRVEEIFATEKVHNGWTAYNAVNYYFNHDYGRNLQNRYNSLWFGYNKTMDLRALELIEQF